MTVTNKRPKKLITVPVSDKATAIKMYGGREVLQYGHGIRRSSSDMEGSLDSVINDLVKLRESHRDRYRDLCFKEASCGCPYECGCGKEFMLYGTRYETDLERDVNIRNELRDAETTEQRERQKLAAMREEMAKLEAKYGTE